MSNGVIASSVITTTSGSSSHDHLLSGPAVLHMTNQDIPSFNNNNNNNPIKSDVAYESMTELKPAAPMPFVDQRYMSTGFYPPAPAMMPPGNCSAASMYWLPHDHSADPNTFVDVDQLIPPSLSGKNVILQSL